MVLQLVQNAGHLPDRVKLDTGFQVHFPRGFRRVQRRHRIARRSTFSGASTFEMFGPQSAK